MGRGEQEEKKGKKEGSRRSWTGKTARGGVWKGRGEKEEELDREKGRKRRSRIRERTTRGGVR